MWHDGFQTNGKRRPVAPFSLNLLRGRESNPRPEVMLTTTTFVALWFVVWTMPSSQKDVYRLVSTPFLRFLLGLGSALPFAIMREGFTEFGR